MPSSTANLLVSVVNGVACVKLTGRANFAVSVDFKNLVHSLQAQGVERFIVDLSGCVLMDSTFLGVLAGIGANLPGRKPEMDHCSFELLNPTERVFDLLDNLGVTEYFRIVRGSDPQHLEFRAVESSPCSKLEMSQNCLEAHETLMNVNPENIAKFKDVTEFFTKDILREKSKRSIENSTGA
jgi:anti-sigma B factor antagonist